MKVTLEASHLEILRDMPVLAPWISKILTPRPHKVELLSRIAAPLDVIAPELREFMQLREAELIDDGPLRIDFDEPSVNALRGMLENRFAFLPFLCGGLQLARAWGGHVFFCATFADAGDGRSCVFSLEDEYEAEVVMTAPSIEAWLFETIENEFEDQGKTLLADVEVERNEPKIKERLLRPEVLFSRVRWLVNALDLDLWDDADLVELLEAAPPLAQYEKEAARAAQWPHLEVYWLWAQFLFDDRQRLTPRLPALCEHPVALVRESAQTISALLADAMSPVELGFIAEEELLAARDAVVSAARPGQLGRGAKKRAARAPRTPVEEARRWLHRQLGDVPALLNTLSTQPPTDELKTLVVEGLERCTRTDVADLLARAASTWCVVEATPALRRLLETRAVFWKHEPGFQPEAAGVFCARALLRTSEDHVELFDFLATELVRSGESGLLPERVQQEACAFLGALLFLDPTHEQLIEEARRRLATEAASIVKGSLVKAFDTNSVFALLTPIDMKGIASLHAAVTPFASFDDSLMTMHPILQQHLQILRGWAAKIVTPSER